MTSEICGTTQGFLPVNVQCSIDNTLVLEISFCVIDEPHG